MVQQKYFRSLQYCRVKANQGGVIGIERYGSRRWMYWLDCSGGDEEMEGEQMTEIEQFEHMSKDEPEDHTRL